MKDGVIIVNTSRGEIVATHDLVVAIRSGKVRGAALDVFEGEKEFIFKVSTTPSPIFMSNVQCLI